MPLSLRDELNSYPLISIIMPSFNQARFIGESINSVLGQDYPSIELIIADGQSSDETIAILSSMASSDDRIRWFSEPDSGPADALNKALSKTRGSYIGWLNSDDLYTSGAISRAVKKLSESRDYVLTYGSGQHIDENGLVIGKYPTLPPEVGVERFRDGCFICQPTVFFKRSAWILLGKLDTTLKTAFDFDYWVRAFLAFPGRIAFVDEFQASSRLHDDCITMKMRRTVALDGLQVVAKHLGDAPVHWLTTYADEIYKLPPEDRPTHNLLQHLKHTLVEAAPYLSPEKLETLTKAFHSDARFR